MRCSASFQGGRAKHAALKSGDARTWREATIYEAGRAVNIGEGCDMSRTSTRCYRNTHETNVAVCCSEAKAQSRMRECVEEKQKGALLHLFCER